MRKGILLDERGREGEGMKEILKYFVFASMT